MSYILDALRKSENQRRLGQAPDLSAAPDQDPGRSGRQRRLGPWPVALGLLLVVLAAGGFYWFGMPERSDSEAPRQVAEQGQPEPVEAVPAEPAQTPGEAGSASDEPTPAGEVAQPETAQPEASERRRRTVVDRRSPSQRPVTSVSRPAPARPGAVATPPPVVPEGERERLVADAERAQRLIEAQARRSQPATAAPDTADPAAAERGDAEWSPDRAEHLEVWELPLSVRRELPDLKLSIHVFSAEPSERFVLINGERRLEGEDLGEGARLAEISRLGAVVDFRDYRFLLKP